MNNEVKQKSDAEESLSTCPCGYNKNHPMVQAKGEYTAWGHFLVTFGISYRPLKVRYLCLKCDTYFDETRDIDVLNEFS